MVWWTGISRLEKRPMRMTEKYTSNIIQTIIVYCSVGNLRWELENYLYDEEVLKIYCAKHGLMFDQTSYNKYIADVVNGNIKDKTGLIKNICGILGNGNREKFKIELSKCVTQEMNVYTELCDCIFY